MTDDSADDRQFTDDGDELTDASQLDDVLDRLESSLSDRSESTAEEGASTAEGIESTGEHSEPTNDSDPSHPSTAGDFEATADEPESADRQPDTSRSDGSRLWDRFAGNRTPDSESPPQSDPTAPEFDSGATSFTPAVSDTHQPVDDQFDAEQSVDDRFDTEQSADDRFDAEQSADDQPDTESRTSFRGILDRISHRIGDAGSLFGSAADGSTDHSTDSEPSTTAGEGPSTTADERSSTTAAEGPSASTDRQSTPDQNTATRQSSDPARSAGARSTQGRSSSIEQVLEQIDLFGRATASSQVLLLSPTAHSVTSDIYQRVLLPTDGTGQNVLLVSALSSPTDRLSTVRDIPDWSHGKTGVIEIGQSVLKPSTPTQGPDLTVQLDVYKQLSSFQNLAKLGVNISHITSQWNATNRPSVVGVHTLSSIQQYVGNETMFQFLFTLKGQLNSMGVRGFYHMDPAAHTENEINTINSAFDIVVTVDSNGSIDIE